MRNIYGVVLSSALALAALTACDPASEPAAAPAPKVGAGSAAVPTATSAAAPAMDATTKKACGELLNAVAETAKNAADAEKIGPPVGYVAVSTQYIAGSAAMSAYSIGANETVAAAADKVNAAMEDLDKAWNANPKKAPSKADLDAAVKELKAACAAG
ncbi:hypothetical protein [Actinoplanes regularis]|uniref:Lipoprotein n=1 Tax=Actinoplanes regularis TaxID=52697 RepID=A0A238Y092_9ACTN|nr:hypothetical protein [Actinoplanes regularis]GIE86335.1 hypothetical protein Are01nite_28150 [Actinoplanes regularis]SNR64073.1 hypothetical protein SAMN06264365_104119 [Actinoplanes regularis]